MLEHAERIADGYRRLQYEMDLFTDRLGGELKVGASTTIAQYNFCRRCWPVLRPGFPR